MNFHLSSIYMHYLQWNCKNMKIDPRLRGKHLAQNTRELPAAARKFALT